MDQIIAEHQSLHRGISGCRLALKRSVFSEQMKEYFIMRLNLPQIQKPVNPSNQYYNLAFILQFNLPALYCLPAKNLAI